MAFHLGQVEVRAGAFSQQIFGVVEEIKAKVEDAARNRLAVQQDVFLKEVPAARPDHQGGGLRLRAYFLPSGLVKSIVPLIASRKLSWPWILLSQVGELASSKSAM